MAYVIDRLEKATSYSSMQPVERVGQTTQRRLAVRDARRVAIQHPHSWVQVRYAGGGAVLVTYTSDGIGVRKV